MQKWAHSHTHIHSPTFLSPPPSSNPDSQFHSIRFPTLSPPTHLPCFMSSYSPLLSTAAISKHSAVAASKASDILLRESYLTDAEIDHFAGIANKLADAAGEVIRKFFRNKFEILDKDDLSPVTIADRTAEEAMVAIIMEHLPSHAIFGEEQGWRCKEQHSDYVWVLDPIDGTKSFITGKPLFGTLIALLYKGEPILGIIDQPILRERWIGMLGRKTTLNGQEVSTRSCADLSQAYLYTTSPHLFSEAAEEAFVRVRNKVKVPLYGCDCYAYALLASGFVDLVIESGLKPYDFLALIPVIKGAGGTITDWKGEELYWEASSESHATGFNVAAAGDSRLHQQAVSLLEWN